MGRTKTRKYRSCLRVLVMMMNKYWAAYKHANRSTPVCTTLHAPNVGAALDMMMAYVGKTRTEDDDEYDLYEVKNDTAYKSSVS